LIGEVTPVRKMQDVNKVNDVLSKYLNI